MGNIKRKIKIVGILIIIAIVVIVVFFSLSKKKATIPIQTPVAITGSTPSEGASGVNVFDPITFTFNQYVDPLTITVTSDPAENWTVTQTDPKSITVNHKLYLQVATTYTLTVLQHGNPVGKITFQTASDQNDPRQLQSLQSEVQKNYPLASLTPYQAQDYTVVYSAPLTFEIDIKTSISEQDAISQVKAWVKSNGIDPATHKYNVVIPSPTP